MDTYTFYKLYLDDEHECYVGKTKRLLCARKGEHKYSCYNEKRRSYNYQIYEYIRKNKGFSEWKILELEKGEYDKESSKERERYWYDLLDATLNMDLPNRSTKESIKNWYSKKVKCSFCNLEMNRSSLKRHIERMHS